MFSKEKAKLPPLAGDMTPCKRLAAILSVLDLSRKEVADTLDISLSSVAMYIAGLHRIRRVVALAFQCCYGVRADWLLYGKKPVFVKPEEAGVSIAKKVSDVLIGFNEMLNQS